MQKGIDNILEVSWHFVENAVAIKEIMLETFFPLFWNICFTNKKKAIVVNIEAITGKITAAYSTVILSEKKCKNLYSEAIICGSNVVEFSVSYPTGTYLIVSINGKTPCSTIVFAHLRKKKGSKSGPKVQLFLVISHKKGTPVEGFIFIGRVLILIFIHKIIAMTA